MSFNNIPQKLRQLDNWLNWKKEKDQKGEWTKVPYQPRAIKSKASSIDERDWSDFNTAANNCNNEIGLGFVFQKYRELVGIDFDNKSGDPAIDRSHKIDIARLNSYTEWSPSGKGWHVILEGNIPNGGKNNRQRGIEIYDTSRFFTMTGNVYNPMPIVARPDDILNLYVSLGGDAEPNEQGNRVGGKGYPWKPEWDRASYEPDDTKLCDKIYKGKSGQKFSDLWFGNWQKWYPPPKLSQSEADWELMDMIVFACRNREQSIRVFNQSMLAPFKRPVWAKKKDLRIYVPDMAHKQLERYHRKFPPLPPVNWTSFSWNSLNGNPPQG